MSFVKEIRTIYLFDMVAFTTRLNLQISWLSIHPLHSKTDSRRKSKHLISIEHLLHYDIL